MSLSRNKKRAIEALMRSATIAGAARQCGLSERTLWRYLADAEFAAALSERQSRATAALAAGLSALSDAAIVALANLVASTDTPPSVRARVALGVLRQRQSTIELADLSDRVAALEEQKFLGGAR